MPLVAGDIEYRLSGGAAQSDPALSLGGAKSSVEFTNGNVFDDVSGAESASGDTEYRGVYVQNNYAGSPSLDLQNARIWIQVNTPSPDTVLEIALCAEGPNATMETIGNENTQPVGSPMTFSSAPLSYATGLVLGTLAPGQFYGVWIRRVVSPGASAFSDSWTIRVEGDTAA
jgi:hypothetical protein